MKNPFVVSKNFIIIIFFQILFFNPGLQLNAQNALADTAGQKIKSQINGNKKQNSLIQKLSDRLDRFFSDQHIEEELQTSSIRLKPGIRWSEGGQLDFQLATRLNLVLPRLQDRWQIFFSSIPDEDNDQDPDRNDYTDNQPSVVDEEQTSSLLGLQFAPITDLKQHLKFITGIKIRSDEFNPFGLTRFRYRFSLGSWSLRFTQSVFYFADNGFGENTQLDFNRPLGDKTFFRLRNSLTWSEQTRGVGLKQTFFLRHFISQNSVLGVSWRIGGHTSPEMIVDGHTIALEFRTKLWLDWLFWEVSQEALFHRDTNFRYQPALLASLEMIF